MPKKTRGLHFVGSLYFNHPVGFKLRINSWLVSGWVWAGSSFFPRHFVVHLCMYPLYSIVLLYRQETSSRSPHAKQWISRCQGCLGRGPGQHDSSVLVPQRNEFQVSLIQECQAHFAHTNSYFYIFFLQLCVAGSLALQKSINQRVCYRYLPKHLKKKSVEKNIISGPWRWWKQTPFPGGSNIAKPVLYGCFQK